MRCFFDTSALIKYYIEESGSEEVTQLLQDTEEVYVSEITRIESFSMLKRILTEGLLSAKEYASIKNEIHHDFAYYSSITVESILPVCEDLIDRYQLKTLDSIQLASSLSVKDEITYFVCCDTKLLRAAEKEKFKTIDPNSIR